MTTAQLAEAVKDALAAGSFTQSFTPTRVALPEFKLVDLGTLTVTVVPREMTLSLDSRRDNACEMGIDVAVHKRVSDTGTTTVDALMALVQEIADHMTRRDLTAAGGTAFWRETRIDPLYAPEELRQNRLFVSVLRLDYLERQIA